MSETLTAERIAELERENARLRKIEKAAQRVIAHRRADGQYCVLTVDLDHLAALTGEQP